ncbi:M-phase inducer phosphatase [Aphelenchoides fujianensis]|nr:M-phase inducer phosphatase [Aphelenchoides fujianensis]
MDADIDQWQESSDESMCVDWSPLKPTRLVDEETSKFVYVDENARMGIDDDDDEKEVEGRPPGRVLFSTSGGVDESSMDSGHGSSSFSAWTSSCSASNSQGRIPTILESSTENLAMDLSDHERETLSTLQLLERSKISANDESPKSRRRRGLQDITNRLPMSSTTPKKSPAGTKMRKILDRKRSCTAYSFKAVAPAAGGQLANRKRRGEFLREKRISPQGIPAGARPIRRIQSTSILESSFNSILSPESVEHYSLRTVDKPQIEDTAFRSIDGRTLAELLNSLSAEEFAEKFVLIDCRYPFEYEGGHVKNAINIFNPELISCMFYPQCTREFAAMNAKIPIFYCEFSQKRGPKMARELRRCDRMVNEGRYPHLDYPEIYVLDHGYRRFFQDDKLHELCEPQHYTPMIAPAFSAQLKHYNQHKKKAGRR